MKFRVFVFALGMAVLAPLAQAQDFSAQAVANAIACSPNDGEMDGGQLEIFATASAAASGDCGANPPAEASSSAYADLAAGVVAATAQGSGLIASHRATANSDFRDRLRIVAPPDVDSVAIEATVTFTVEADDSFPQSENRLIANVAVVPNEIDLFLCNPALCPGSPLVPTFVSEVFVAQRNVDGSFFDIILSALARADMAAGSAALAVLVTVAVADDSGAVLISDSGVFGSGPADSDSDSIPDALDNCSLVANPDQRDTNGDGFGNVCDPDLNNDLIVNVVDLGLLRGVFFTADPDADFNGDGVVNVLDLGVLRTYFFAPPGPGAVTR